MINLRLDKTGGINKGDIVISEHDNLSEVYIIELTKKNVSYDLTGKTIRLSLVDKRTKRGESLTLPIENASQGKVKLEIVKNITQSNGNYICQLDILGANEFKEGFPYFDITVKGSIFDEISGEMVKNPSFVLLENTLAKVAEWDKYFKDVAPQLENKYLVKFKEFKEEIRKDVANYKTDLTNANNTFKTAVNERMTTVENKVNTFDSKVTNNTNKINKSLRFVRDLNSNDDLNNLVEFGIYFQNTNSNATYALNYPVPRAGALEVFGSMGHIYQRYTGYSEYKHIYIRGKYNNVWCGWVDLADAQCLGGKPLQSSSTIFDRVPFVGVDGGLEIGKYIDFHLTTSSADNDGRIILEADKKFTFSRPVNVHEFTTQYLNIKTYGNGSNYGSTHYAKVWLDNRNNAKKLVFDDIMEMQLGNAKLTGSQCVVGQVIASGNVDTTGGAFRDTGDSNIPYIGTRRSNKAWAFADKNGGWWDVLAKNTSTSSDQRIKLEAPTTRKTTDLERIKALKPKEFKFYNDTDNRVYYGFYAQEVEEVIPTAVNTVKYEKEEQKPLDKEGNKMNDFKFVNYNDIVATLVGAVQQLSEEMEKLKKGK